MRKSTTIDLADQYQFIDLCNRLDEILPGRLGWFYLSGNIREMP